MRVKVELHPEVVWYLKSRCNAEEVDGFYRQLARVRAAPISNSEAIANAPTESIPPEILPVRLEHRRIRLQPQPRYD
jgi:hypothetical protein